MLMLYPIAKRLEMKAFLMSSVKINVVKDYVIGML